MNEKEPYCQQGPFNSIRATGYISVVASVFAGQDLEATARFRIHLADIPPSSSSIALFKDNELVLFKLSGRQNTN
ncbi:BrxA/BrxB family bacilliredoxin [Chitinophaga sp. Cy-1792]|uniref:BrxA/BrxB family bacilliredoxin n=1 Tax=Chitinophaga sp. Cy-1792 TaxID=2608339 RepID=UPI001966A2CD